MSATIEAPRRGAPEERPDHPHCHDDPAQRKRREEVERTPKGTPLVALVGRPNSGKSSLFNTLTGGDAHVGNFPGITVEILEATVELPRGGRAVLADLPGIYSIEATLDPETDEGITRAFLDDAAQRAGTRPLLVVQVIDATQLALGLRLTRELAGRTWPLLVVVTQRDLMEAEGRTLDVRALGEALGVPVVAASARELASKADVLAAIERALSGPAGRGAPDAGGAEGGEPARAPFDPGALARRAVSDAPHADEAARRRRTATARVDAWLLHPVLGPVLFLALMASLFAAVFLVAEPVTAALDAGAGWLGAQLGPALGDGLLASFVVDGLLGGVGTVLAFMPQVVVLAVAIELLEASGYLARGAFLVDRVLRLLGLSGRSFLPLLMGHACAVPALGATRIIRDPRERLTAILVLPLMTCSARIPTYALLLTTFFSSRGPLFKAIVFLGLYAAGWLSGLVASLALRKTATRGRALPLVLEIPAYRAPQPRLVLRKGWQAAARFARDVGTTILAVSAVLWVLLRVPAPGADPALPPIERSIAASVGRALEPATAPVGFDWRINVGLIGSFGAREVMVSTLGVIFGLEDAEGEERGLAERIRTTEKPDGTPLYTAQTGAALLAFFVLACQCMSTIAAIRRETRSWRWPAFVLAYTYALAYGAALVVGRIVGALAGG